MQIFRYFFRKAFFSRFCYATLSVLFISKLSTVFFEIIVGRLAVNPRLYSGQSATLKPLLTASNAYRTQVEGKSGFVRGFIGVYKHTKPPLPSLRRGRSGLDVSGLDETFPSPLRGELERGFLLHSLSGKVVEVVTYLQVDLSANQDLACCNILSLSLCHLRCRLARSDITAVCGC